MKIIEVDEELYQYIAGKTQSIGESASDILRRLLDLSSSSVSTTALNFAQPTDEVSPTAESPAEVQSAVSNSSVSATEPKPEAPKVAKKQSDVSVQQTVGKLQTLLASADFQEESKAVVRFLNILSVLYRTNPESFAQATEQETSQGRTRTYFARDEATLLAAGNHTKPRQIPDTPYWVITNTNSGRKMLMLERTMQFMQLPDSLIDDVRAYFVAN
ncbi:replication initiation negative regulator SeqA [Pasteurellaceae bacterium LIM206]|nr:replication initiation negative regulator SeqA [Pasteurellaceae bacterium LIM206]